MRSSSPRSAFALAMLAAMAGICLAEGLCEAAPRVAPEGADPTDEFIARLWPDPLPPQGNPPAAFSPLEASLDPASCGQCHAPQLHDWASSLHGRTMGPGVLWQFEVMDQKGANGCMKCHAPLAEQKALLALERKWKHAPAAPPPDYVPPGLHLQGLVCAACHVRRHARFGPPPSRGASSAPQAVAPHGGFTANAAFEDSRFCAVCHQFPPDWPKLNGKLLENTFEEWRTSAAARQGRSCQSCHMPGRRHLWRGIHDADMTRRALSVSLEIGKLKDGAMSARAGLVNSGAGHRFPTYLVPEVVATLQLVDAGGVVQSILDRRVIGRNVNLELTQEIFDTRIAPGGRMSLAGRFASPRAKGWRVELHVLVHPDKHYERLFRSILERRDRLTPAAISQLRQALARSESSGYELYRIIRAVPPSP